MYYRVISKLFRRLKTALLLAVGCTTFSCPLAHVGAADDTAHGNRDFGVDEPADNADVGRDTEETEEADGDATGADVTFGDLWDELRLGQLVPIETGPMSGFFNALDSLGDKEGKRLVRILQYGDSHTAADVLPSTIRRGLQKRFGYGGRGFVYLGKPWRSYRPADVETGVKGSWETRRIFLSKDPAVQDGRYGLGGVAVDTIQPGAQVSVSTSPTTYFGNKASRFDIFYLRQPGGGCFTVLVDDKKYKKVCTASKQLRTGMLRIDLKERSHRVVLLVNSAKVRLFGAAVEREGPGVVYDALGINGAFFHTPLRWDASLLAEQVEQRAPDLIITMYGANEADSARLTEERYASQVRQALERIRAGSPDASCLLLGPMDREVYRINNEEDRLDRIIGVQQEVADEVGCSFMNLRELMGGTGAFDKWRVKGLAQKDGVHLTVSGYLMLGEAIAQQLLERYDQHRLEKYPRPKKRPPSPSGETPEGERP